ncbi:MAG: vWA domain-containing protein [Anaerolineaceae bacterium]|nr:vWA domain-containing protein [Anaerolineaceae bacterium]
MNERQIVPGSISAVAKSTGKSIAELFTNAEVVTIVDVSGSMSDRDSTGGKSRYEVACDELASIQANMPGKVAVIAFSEKTQFCPSGVPFYEGSSTNLAGALKYAKIADVPGIKVIVISDGEPDDKRQALSIARTYKNHISVIYVGPESRPSGREFLQQLAAATGGQAVTADCAKNLFSSIQTLLLKG